VAGRQRDLQRNRLSLLEQQHPDYRVYFVIQDENDAALPVLSTLVSAKKHATLVHAGPAVRCSQKNHNIITGSRAAAAAEVLVFCDSSHLAEKDWLTRLVTPLLPRNTQIISSGYHQVMVKGLKVNEAGRAICVAILRLARMIPGFEQPWGGATAILRQTFEETAIAEMWSDRVVDDVTLAAHLPQHGLALTIPGRCDLHTDLAEADWAAWQTWLTRQWAYLKFVFPALWFFLGCAGITFTLALLSCLVIAVAAPFASFPKEIQTQALVALAPFFILGLFLWWDHPQPGSLFIWLPALPAALIMAGWCHARTWFAASITWAGITYTVTRGGRVSRVDRP
jgi:hypothetical protein